MDYVTLAWDEDNRGWYLITPGGLSTYLGDAVDAIAGAKGKDFQVRVITIGAEEHLIDLMFQAVYQGVQLYDTSGEKMHISPVPEANIRYIDRKQLGAILPDGWFIEQQLNRYTPMHGDTLSLSAEPSLERAIAAIRVYLLGLVNKTSLQVAQSIAASETYQQQGFNLDEVSSDSPKGAAD